MKRRCNVGFTLTELLMVLAVLAVLVTLLVPAVHSCMDIVQRVICSNRMGHIGQAHAAYIADHRTILAHGWPDELAPYLDAAKTTGAYAGVFSCPSVPVAAGAGTGSSGTPATSQPATATDPPPPATATPYDLYYHVDWVASPNTSAPYWRMDPTDANTGMINPSFGAGPSQGSVCPACSRRVTFYLSAADYGRYTSSYPAHYAPFGNTLAAMDANIPWFPGGAGNSLGPLQTTFYVIAGGCSHFIYYDNGSHSTGYGNWLNGGGAYADAVWQFTKSAPDADGTPNTQVALIANPLKTQAAVSGSARGDPETVLPMYGYYGSYKNPYYYYCTEPIGSPGNRGTMLHSLYYTGPPGWFTSRSNMGLLNQSWSVKGVINGVHNKGGPFDQWSAPPSNPISPIVNYTYGMNYYATKPLPNQTTILAPNPTTLLVLDYDMEVAQDPAANEVFADHVGLRHPDSGALKANVLLLNGEVRLMTLSEVQPDLSADSKAMWNMP